MKQVQKLYKINPNQNHPKYKKIENYEELALNKILSFLSIEELTKKAKIKNCITTMTKKYKIYITTDNSIENIKYYDYSKNISILIINTNTLKIDTTNKDELYVRILENLAYGFFLYEAKEIMLNYKFDLT
jgi:hypothetical protein